MSEPIAQLVEGTCDLREGMGELVEGSEDSFEAKEHSREARGDLAVGNGDFVEARGELTRWAIGSDVFRVLLTKTKGQPCAAIPLFRGFQRYTGGAAERRPD